MSVFNTDQARQFYVSNTANCFSAMEADEYFKVDPGSSYSAVASDVIQKSQVEYINITSALNKLVPLRKKYTITVNSDILDSGNVPAGFHYVLKVIFRQYVSQSDEDRLAKVVDVYTKSAMTPTNFYGALKDALDLALTSEEAVNGTPLVGRSSSSGGLVLTEAYMPWKRGKMSVATLPFDVFGEDVEIDSIDTEWAEITPAYVSKDSTDTVAGAEKLADMEWFFLGERGDIYRGIGWPNNFEPTYQIDATGSTAYSVVDLTYFYKGNNEDIQHSRKTITVALAGVAAATAAAKLATVLPNAIIMVDGEKYTG